MKPHASRRSHYPARGRNSLKELDVGKQPRLRAGRGQDEARRDSGGVETEHEEARLAEGDSGVSGHALKRRYGCIRAR